MRVHSHIYLSWLGSLKVFTVFMKQTVLRLVDDLTVPQPERCFNLFSIITQFPCFAWIVHTESAFLWQLIDQIGSEDHRLLSRAVCSSALNASLESACGVFLFLKE